MRSDQPASDLRWQETAGAVMLFIYQVIGRRRSNEMIELNDGPAGALDTLKVHGKKGVICNNDPDDPFPDYVDKLRHRHGLNIETNTRTYDGLFPGSYTRYVLKSRVKLVNIKNVPKALTTAKLYHASNAITAVSRTASTPLPDLGDGWAPAANRDPWIFKK